MSQPAATKYMPDISDTKQDATSAGHLPENDFIIICPSQDSGLTEAILSLSYLPPQFKLRILAGSENQAFLWATDETLRSRISVDTASTPVSDSYQLEQVGAVVYSEGTPVLSESATPRVIISKAADTAMKDYGNHNFVVSSNSPEALASAMLSIAKAA